MENSKDIKLPGVTIELFNPEKDYLNEITELLHQAYAPLAEQGLNYVAATQPDSVTGERLRTGVAYIARSQGFIVGTGTYYAVPSDKTEPAFYNNYSVAHFGQLAVLPLMQGTGVGSMLMKLIEDNALKDKKREIACDTAEGAEQLIDYYLKRGYRKVGEHQWPHAFYRSVILSKAL